MYKAENFEDALAKAEHLVADGGYGHTSSLYVNEVTETEKINEFAARMKTCRNIEHFCIRKKFLSVILFPKEQRIIKK